MDRNLTSDELSRQRSTRSAIAVESGGSPGGAASGDPARWSFCLGCFGFGIWLSLGPSPRQIAGVTKEEAARRVVGDIIRRSRRIVRAAECPRCGSRPPEHMRSIPVAGDAVWLVETRDPVRLRAEMRSVLQRSMERRPSDPVPSVIEHVGILVPVYSDEAPTEAIQDGELIERLAAEEATALGGGGRRVGVRIDFEWSRERCPVRAGRVVRLTFALLVPWSFCFNSSRQLRILRHP